MSSDRLSLQFFPFINQHFLDRFWQRLVFSLWKPQTEHTPRETERPEYKELGAARSLREHHHEGGEDGADPSYGADYPQGGVPDAGGEDLTGENVDGFESSSNAELGCKERLLVVI